MHNIAMTTFTPVIFFLCVTKEIWLLLLCLEKVLEKRFSHCLDFSHFRYGLVWFGYCGLVMSCKTLVINVLQNSVEGIFCYSNTIYRLNCEISLSSW